MKLFDKFTTKVVRLVGVSVSTLIPKSQYFEQLTIFSKQNEDNKDINVLISKLNKVAGSNIFIKASDKR